MSSKIECRSRTGAGYSRAQFRWSDSWQDVPAEIAADKTRMQLLLEDPHLEVKVDGEYVTGPKAKADPSNPAGGETAPAPSGRDIKRLERKVAELEEKLAKTREAASKLAADANAALDDSKAKLDAANAEIARLSGELDKALAKADGAKAEADAAKAALAEVSDGKGKK